VYELPSQRTFLVGPVGFGFGFGHELAGGLGGDGGFTGLQQLTKETENNTRVIENNEKSILKFDSIAVTQCN